jgi:ELWxxDGT repeat protein
MMKKLLLMLTAFFLAQANAQQLELAADINTDGYAFSQFNSRPSGFTEFNNKLYFSARGPKTGQELFSYDGTDVELVADINQGLSGLNYDNSYPKKLTVINNKLYFIATQANDSAYLYSYDGTGVPTVITKLETQANYAGNVDLISFNNKIYFDTYNSVADMRTIWEYDGTNTPSVLLTEASTSISYGYRAFIELAGKLYFYKNGTQAFNSRYYVYDGVNPPSTAPNSSSIFNPTDGAIVYNNKIYFNSYENQGNTTGYELWSYDGVNVPSVVNDINPGSAGSYPGGFVVFNNKLHFTADDGASGRELWHYDGATISMVADINTSGASGPSYLTVHNSKLYFVATDGLVGSELFEYDGTSSPSLTTEMIAGVDDGQIKYLTSFQNELIFAATDGTVAEEPYKYDGTSISLVANIFDGSNGSLPRYMTEYKGKIYFSAFGDSENGVELYSYDGVNAELVADLDTAHLAQFGAGSSSQPSNLFVFNDFLYFKASDGNGYKYWKYDAVNAPIVDTNIVNGSFGFTEMNNILYYTSNDGINGLELWQYDGTTSSMVHDINPGSANGYPNGLTVYDNKLIFKADDGVNGYELWQYNGSNTPTLVADIHTGIVGSNPNGFKEFNGDLYFQAYGDTVTGTELWKYDGTNAPSLAADILPGFTNNYPASGAPYDLQVVKDKLVFIVYEPVGDKELWEFDGTNTPTKITNYTPANSSYLFSSMTIIDDVLYFWADEGAGFGYELYKYDGTGAPVMFDEVNIGSGDSKPQTPSNIVKYDGDIYLGANDGILGYVFSSELYKIASCAIDTIVTENNVTLTVNETSATYQWVDCDDNNAFIDGETNASFTATQTGNYACIINKAACQETTACKTIVISGIENLDLKSKITVYPNPSSELLNIKTDVTIYSINIYSVIGEKVQSETTTNFSIKALNQGIYFLEIQTAEGVLNSQIVKK